MSYPQGPPGPPPPGHGPSGGHPQWVPYPGQQPGYGMPVPPPRRSRGLLWTVIGVVVALAAAGVTFLLVQQSDGDGPGGDGGGAPNGDGTAQGGGGCDGDRCVGGYPYVNACGVLDPSNVAARIGQTGSGGLLVQENYADPLPRVDDPARAAWTYGLTSNCHLTPEDSDGAAFRSVTLTLKQTAEEAPAPRERGRPIEGADGAVAEELDGGVRVHWRYRNVSATLELIWGNRKPALPDAAVTGLVEMVGEGLGNPPSEPRDLGELSDGTERVVIDACTVFTGEDFQSATRYVVDPTNVTRTYSTAFSTQLNTTCTRFTATTNAGFPAPKGATFLDGSMSPRVTVAKTRDQAAAQAELSGNRAQITGAVDIPGLGPGAFFGASTSSNFTLRFVAGFHLVTVDCGLSNGNADWTAEDMRSRLEPLATAIAERMA